MSGPSFAARWVLTPEGILTDQTVVMAEDGMTVSEVRPHRVGESELINGLLMPGLVNAHLHLELSGLPIVSGGQGLVPWVRGLLDIRKEIEPDDEAALFAIQQMVQTGTVAVSDICSGIDYSEELVLAGICGVSQVEHLGMDPISAGWIADAAKERGEVIAGKGGEMVVRPTPHALYSTRREIVSACLEGKHCAAASIHMAEDTAETEFLRSATGPFADLLDDLSVGWRPYTPPGCSGVEWLHSMGLLNQRMFMVHGVELTDNDIELLVNSGVSTVLCPRSNLHIGGQLPRVLALMEAGVALALGTDSTTSCPDLDLMNEIKLLMERFPAVEPDVWLQMATAGGADAIGVQGVGRLQPGAKPGLLLLADEADTLRGLLLSSQLSRRLLTPAFGHFGDKGAE